MLVQLPINCNWTLVKTYEEFVHVIETYGLPKFISYDHDLGDRAYHEYFKAVAENRKFNYDAIDEKTGYDCVKFVIDKCIACGNIPHPEYAVHSMNAIGKANIISYIKSYERSRSSAA
jgi:hypothetical protein